MWIISFYKSSRGDEPVKEVIDDLQAQAKAKVIRKIELLELFGPSLGMPHAKQFESNLYELTIHGRQEVRIFYSFLNHQVCLLHGFIKKTQKTPPREVNTAKQRLEELTRYNL